MAPTNDNFSSAIALSGTSVSISGTNVEATAEAGEPTHAGGNSSPINSVWYKWTAPTSGLVFMELFNSDFDTTLGVFQGATIPSLTEVVSNEDLFGIQSQVQFNVVAGTTYFITVDGSDTATGNFTLNLNYAQIGTSGQDALNGDNGNNVIYGRAGNDIINGNGGYDLLYGESGNDQINGGSLTDLIYGGSGNDTINGNGGFNYLYGQAGRDRIAGSASSEEMGGGDGDDLLFGNGGNDRLEGDRGNDLIFAGSGDDLIFGGSGNDSIYGGGGEDTIDPGAGSDLVVLGSGDAVVYLETGSGSDKIINFQPGQTQFSIIDFLVDYSDLTFTDKLAGTQISYQGDVLALVAFTSADVFVNNPDIFI